MRYAYIESGVVKEIIETDQDITTLYHSSMLWVEVTESVSCGDLYSEGIFSKPVVAKVNVTKEAVEGLRLVSYANPISGCDRYFAEVMSLQAEGFTTTSAEVKEAKAKGLARKLEIQTLYPWPSE